MPGPKGYVHGWIYVGGPGLPKPGTKGAPNAHRIPPWRRAGGNKTKVGDVKFSDRKVISPRFVDRPPSGSKQVHLNRPVVRQWHADRAAFTKKFPNAHYFDPHSGYGTVDRGENVEQFMTQTKTPGEYKSIGSAKRIGRGSYEVLELNPDSTPKTDRLGQPVVRLFSNRQSVFNFFSTHRGRAPTRTEAAAAPGYAGSLGDLVGTNVKPRKARTSVPAGFSETLKDLVGTGKKTARQ